MFLLLAIAIGSYYLCDKYPTEGPYLVALFIVATVIFRWVFTREDDDR